MIINLDELPDVWYFRVRNTGSEYKMMKMAGDVWGCVLPHQNIHEVFAGPWSLESIKELDPFTTSVWTDFHTEKEEYDN